MFNRIGGSVVKNLLTNAGDSGDTGSIPGPGRSPGGGNGNPFQYSCLGNPMDRGAWQTTVYRAAKSQTWLSMHACILCNRIVEAYRTDVKMFLHIWILKGKKVWLWNPLSLLYIAYSVSLLFSYHTPCEDHINFYTYLNMHVNKLPLGKNTWLLHLGGIWSYPDPLTFRKCVQMPKPGIILDFASLLSPIAGCQNIESHHFSAVRKRVAENIKCQLKAQGP